MKLTKTLCLVAATVTLALAPINTSTGQINTVLAMQQTKQNNYPKNCKKIDSQYFECPDGKLYYNGYDPYSFSAWVGRFFYAFYSVWSTLNGIFKQLSKQVKTVATCFFYQPCYCLLACCEIRQLAFLLKTKTKGNQERKWRTTISLSRRLCQNIFSQN